MSARGKRAPDLRRIPVAMLAVAVAAGTLAAFAPAPAVASMAPVCQDTSMGPRSGQPDFVHPPCEPEGGSFTYAIVGHPEHGTADVVGDELGYTSEPEFVGTDSFTYQAFDGDQTSNVATVVVTVLADTNDPPVCGEPEPQAVYAGRPTPLVPWCGDPDGDTLTYGVEGRPQPAHGTSSIDDDGVLVYEADEGYSGLDAVPFTASDAEGGTVESTHPVTVALPESPSCATPELTANVLPGGSVPLQLTCTDPQGDDHTYSLGTPPSKGSLGVFDATGSVVYTAETDASGTDSFTLEATNPVGTTATDVTVTFDEPANRAPVCTENASTPRQVNRAVATVLDLSQVCTDADGDPLEFTRVSAPLSGGTLSAGPAATLTYTSPSSHTGADSFTYTATDDEGAASTVTTYRLSVVNRAPTCTGNAASPLTVAADETTTLPLDQVCSDPDDDPLTYAPASASTPHGTVVAVAGTVHYAPTPGYTGQDTIEYAASDGFGGSVTGTFTVTVEESPNGAPTCDPVSDSVPVDGNVTVTLDCSDPDDDQLTLSVAQGPGNGVLGPIEDGQVTYTPDPDYQGPDSFTYRADDGTIQSAPAIVDISVTGDERPPEVSLKVPGRQTPAGVAKAGLKVTSRLDEAAVSTIKLSVTKAVARKLKIDPRAKKSVVIGKMSRSLGPGSKTVAVRLTKRASTAFKKVKAVSVLVSLRAVDAAGNPTQVQRSVTLKKR